MKVSFHHVALLTSLSLSTVLLHAQRRSAGCLYDSALAESVPEIALTRGDYDLHRRASLKMYCPTPGDQGDTGTCTGWASAYAARTIIEAQQYGITDRKRIDQVAFSPSFIYNQIRNPADYNCTQGATLPHALNVLRKSGALPYKEYGFDCDKPISFEQRMRARSKVIQGYNRLYHARTNTNTQTLIDGVRKALAEGKPVICSVRYLSSLDDAQKWWVLSPEEKEGYYHNAHGYHAVAIVSYDDDLEGGAFEIMNSWGTHWGDGGFAWIKYEDFKYVCVEAYELISFPPENIRTRFGASIRIKQKSEELIPLVRNLNEAGLYHTQKAYPPGMQFQFELSTEGQMYFYAFSIDKYERISRMFPRHNQESPLIGYSYAHLVIPGEKLYFQIDNTPSSEYMYFIFSRKAISLEEIIASVQRLKNLPPEARIKQVLRQNGLLKEEGKIKYEYSSASFQDEVSNLAVPIIIEMKRR
ncbi:MAG: DUF4384 domain-containing protein [Cytophagales bacterium]|nr:DUF4384 domain-containing protein [Bernardetiaceae bacterium]MDW8209949.1 DUF4384 domain-containing protein [Cytophagales bacterium]